MKKYVENGRAKLVKGDASSADDVNNVWKVATAEGPVDLIISTIGNVFLS